MTKTILEIIDFGSKPLENMYTFDISEDKRTSYMLTAQGYRNMKEWCAKQKTTMTHLLTYVYENKGEHTFAKCIREIANAISEAPDEIIL